MPVINFLAAAFPTLELSQIRFYKGLPWYINKAYASAITLPGVYNLNRIHIHFSSADHKSINDVSTIVHECFHALQYQELYKSRGVGLLRIFMVHYFAEFFRLFFQNVWKMGIGNARQLAYELHPMEIPAFQVDHNYRNYFTEKGLENALNIPLPEPLKIKHTGHSYNAGYLPYWSSVCLLFFLSIIAPVFELILLLGAGVLFLTGKGLSVIRL
ncbi:MAG: hypothetical protein AAF502_15190 [Bacteroidota bacterium]